MRSKRPLGVTIIAGLSLLGFLLGIFFAGFILVRARDSIQILFGSYIVIISVLAYTTGIGLLRGRRWAWPLSLLGLAITFAQSLLLFAFGSLFAIDGIIVAPIVLIYLNTPQVRSYLGRTEQSLRNLKVGPLADSG